MALHLVRTIRFEKLISARNQHHACRWPNKEGVGKHADIGVTKMQKKNPHVGTVTQQSYILSRCVEYTPIYPIPVVRCN